MAKPNAADVSFSAALAAVKKALHGLEKSQKIRAKKWVERLELIGSHVSRTSRQKWADELLVQVTKRSLREPFLLSPPPTGLPAFPSHILRSVVPAPPPPPPPAATSTSTTTTKAGTVAGSTPLMMSSGRSTPLAAASAVDNLRELEVLRRTVNQQAKAIVKLQALAVQLDDLLLEQRREHESELQRLRGDVHDGATNMASNLASSRVKHSVSTAEDALRARMSWTQEHVSEKSMPDPVRCLGAMLHTTLAPRPVEPASFSPASAPAVASSSGSRFSASATSSTPPRRYHMPPPHHRSRPSQVYLDCKHSRVHESFEFLEKSAGASSGSASLTPPYQRLHASIADNADSDLGSPNSLNLSGGGTTPLIFNPR